jgi:hypothetical protein
MTDPAALQPRIAADKRSEPKCLQNPNVMAELGYAERALTQDRIILVAAVRRRSLQGGAVRKMAVAGVDAKLRAAKSADEAGTFGRRVTASGS